MKVENIKRERLEKGKKISVTFREPNAKYITHTHDYFEIEMIVFGEGTHFINKKSYSLQRGSVMFLTPADCHGLHFSQGAKLWNISFDKSLLTEDLMFRAYSAKEYKRYFEEIEFKKLETCAMLLQAEIETTGCIEPLLTYLLSLILPKPSKEKGGALDAVISYIDMNFRENPSLFDVAKIACLSPVYFGHIFKKYYGIRYSAYLNRKKVMFAKQLLFSGMSVTDCCFESGFTSLSNFLKCFKSETGMSPKEYQKNVEEF